MIVPDVHTHELHIDKNDDLFGEGGYYDDKADKFYHYLWVYHQNGKIDTVIGMKQAYVEQDFSLTRDKNGNEYYVKRYAARPDTNHIYRKTLAGEEEIVATGNFRHVTWLHASDDGSLLYVLNNAIYRVMVFLNDGSTVNLFDRRMCRSQYKQNDRSVVPACMVPAGSSQRCYP